MNPRLTRSVARYRRDTRVIELGPRFFTLRARRKEVLCHELAHAAVHHLYGAQAKPHGPEWRQLVDAAGFMPDARLPRTDARRADYGESRNDESEKAAGALRRPMTSPHVYELRCPVCQMTRRAKRPIRQWRCAECVAAGLPGTLAITRIVAR